MFRAFIEWAAQAKIKFTHYFHRQSLRGKILITAVLVSAGFLTFLVTLLMLVWLGVFGGMPDREELVKVENPLATEVYTADSVLMGRYFIQERSDIRFDKLPAHVIQAVIATEDIRFYNH